MDKILVLLHVDESGKALPKIALEVLGAGQELAVALGSTLTVGVIGEDVQTAANQIANCGGRLMGVEGAEFATSRYASDAAAAEAICRAAEPTIVLAPATSRFSRVVPGVAHRLNGRVDSHISAVAGKDGVAASRWFYRQRIEATLQRSTRPWFLLLDGGSHTPWQGDTGQAQLEVIAVALPPLRTKVTGVRAPKTDEQTIRPDAKLLFVAGAGWTKKQRDGQVHAADAEKLIVNFLRESGASLGSSKSLVEQSGENQTVLKFMTHLNQVGQTGSTPRHPKGLSTCCHGEEPHVVGWRFIHERRAINLDPNCGWARGKADVLYVADAFKVMGCLNALLAEKSLAATAR
ncbi:MAG: electron transfer flavoprotein subunit alpha/FixB family protein [Terriglobales bacterium]